MWCLSALLWAAEGTRLANFDGEKIVLINMHGHPLPLKRAFVAPANARTQRGEADPDQRGDTDRWYSIPDERTEIHREVFGTVRLVCSSHWILISSEVLGEVLVNISQLERTCRSSCNFSDVPFYESLSCTNKRFPECYDEQREALKPTGLMVKISFRSLL